MSRFAIFLAAFAFFAGNVADAATLVVLERKGCVWCAHFEKEIAPAYPKTSEGAIAPLRRVDIDAQWPEGLPAIAHDRFTPTFVLVSDRKVVGTLRGYPGDDFFWPLIDELIAKLPAS